MLKTEGSNLAAVVRQVTGLRLLGGIRRNSARSRCASENFLPTVTVLRETGPVSAGRYSPWMGGWQILDGRLQPAISPLTQIS